jgi:hypothetical protein
MFKVILETASNGLIKKTIDSNHGGGDEEWTTTEVYEELPNDKLNYVVNFFFDLCGDLGINLGNKFSNEVITIQKEWGSSYRPSDEAIKIRIKKIEAELQLLKKWKKL